MKKRILTGFAVLAMSAAAYAATGGDGYETNVPTLYGYLLYDAATFNAADGPCGIYSVDVTPQATVAPVSLDVRANGGGCYAGDRYHAIEYTVRYGSITSCRLKTYDTTDWTLLSETDASEKAIATTMTWNPADGLIYGCFFDNEADVFVFGTLDLATAAPRPVKSLGFALRALAADASGTLYAIGETGAFYRYDTVFRDFVKVGDTGFEPKNIQDATFDYADGRLYWAALNDSESGIYTVDTSTGAATKVASYATGEKEFSSLFSTSPVCGAAVPAMVDRVRLLFDAGKVDGTLEFVMPQASCGGEALSGTLGYTVSDNGTAVGQGTAAPGSQVTLPLSLSRGDHRLAITAGNTAGSGPAFNIHRFLGTDAPSAVTGFDAVRDNGDIILTWDAVTTGANGGVFDPGNIRYNITRQPDGVKVAAGLDATSFTDRPAITALGRYRYEISATDGVIPSPAVSSPEVMIGDAVQPPYAWDFRNRAGFGFFTAVDANGDGSSWMTRDNYGVLYYYNAVNAADDWLVSPPLQLTAGVEYEVSTEMASAMDPERMEVTWGTSPRPASLDRTVIAPTQLTEGTYRYPATYTGTFTPGTSGEHYVGIHCISDPDLLFCYCASFTIKPLSGAGVTEITAGDDVPAEYYNLQGVKVANPAGGIFIRRQGAKADKVRIK